MKPIADKFWLAGMFLLLIGWGICPAPGQEEAPQIFFVPIVGTPSAANGPVPVLLRWYASTDTVPFQQFSLYRKLGNPDSSSSFEALSLTGRLRDPALIRSILEQPFNQRALTDLLALLDEIYEEEVTLASYPDQLIRILNGETVCDTCSLRKNMLIQANYAIAIIEGWGYLDTVSAQTHTYELRGTDGTPGSEQILGRVTVNAQTPTLLPAPQQPEFVNVPGERGHEKVYLKWAMGDPLTEQRSAMFGYNVYRGEGDLTGIPFAELVELGALQQLNQVPILPPAENAVSGDASNAYFFRDDNQTLTAQGIEGEPFAAGEVYTYWVAARDLLGQNGEVSPPLAVTVPDQQAPLIPENVQIKSNPTSGGERLHLTWNRNDDDTLRYNIYRFRQYNHVGHREPLAPIDGLVEGMIGTTDQPLSDLPMYQDPSIQRPQHENMAFWYTVSAVDGWGNESFQSSPVRGILFDETPPDPPSAGQICLYQTVCDLQNVAISTETGDGQQFQITFHVKTHSVTLDNLSIVRVIDQDIATHVQLPLLYPLHRGPFDDQGQVTVTDTFDFSDQKRFPKYYIQAKQGEMPVCEITLPYETHVATYVEQIYKQGHIIYSIDLSTRQEPVCMPIETGKEPHNPVDENGNPVPVVVQLERESEDAKGVILYRSPNCEDFYVVGQAFFDESGQVRIEDDYAPQQGGRVCYAVRVVDENDNQSILWYLPTEVAIAPSGQTIRPAMQSAIPAGDAASPAILVKWFAPTNGLTHFRLYFCPDNQFDETAPNVSLTASQWTLDAETSTFQTILSSIQDGEYIPPVLDQNYYIFCKAYMQSGEERISQNSVLFNWSTTPPPGDYPAWPSRPLPPESEGLVITLFEQDPTYPNLNQQGVGILVGIKNSLFVDYAYAFDFPFQVFRRRMDKPGYTYLQVSPLLENVRRGEKGEVIDPFFLESIQLPATHVDPAQKRILYFLDRSNLISHAKYEYKVVIFDSYGEIKEVRGPSQPIEVTN
ncbi:MAG: hypothetical protein RBU29_13930 [bacterium]|nr:hypothetical protein [bacterium]